METEDLREKWDILRLKVQEREAREARKELDNAALLAKSMSLDEDLIVEMEGLTSMRKRMAALRKKEQSLP